MPDSLPAFPATFLRAHTSGVLVADPLVVRVKFIIDPLSGHPIVACRGDAGEIPDWRLFIPGETEDALILAGEPVLLDPDRDAVCDRWMAYHGLPDIPRYFRLATQWAKLGGVMFDEPDALAPCPFAPFEPRLLKELNADRPALDALASSILRWAASDTVAVGIDNLGLDLRVKRTVVRAPFPTAVPDQDRAREAALLLLKHAR